MHPEAGGRQAATPRALRLCSRGGSIGILLRARPGDGDGRAYSAIRARDDPPGGPAPDTTARCADWPPFRGRMMVAWMGTLHPRRRATPRGGGLETPRHRGDSWSPAPPGRGAGSAAGRGGAERPRGSGGTVAPASSGVALAGVTPTRSHLVRHDRPVRASPALYWAWPTPRPTVERQRVSLTCTAGEVGPRPRTTHPVAGDAADRRQSFRLTFPAASSPRGRRRPRPPLSPRALQVDQRRVDAGRPGRRCRRWPASRAARHLDRRAALDAGPATLRRRTADGTGSRTMPATDRRRLVPAGVAQVVSTYSRDASASLRVFDGRITASALASSGR